jgi:hypothetical protein
MDFQSDKNFNFGTLDLGVLEQNDIWVQTPWLVPKKHYKGGKAFPSLGCSEFYESMYARDLLVHQKCSNFTLTNLLFDLCRPM